LETKLRHKNTQIIRTERLLQTLPSEQKKSFESLLAESRRQRDEIQNELNDLYRQLTELQTDNRKPS